jgi:hypothetical protein
MQRTLAVIVVISSLSLGGQAEAQKPGRGAAGASKQGKGQGPRAVIDKSVRGVVVSRTIVLGATSRAPGKGAEVTLERQASAAGKGWGVTQKSSPLPRSMTQNGRLQEVSARTVTGKGGRKTTILKLATPNRPPDGAVETQVYTNGRRTRIVKHKAPVEKPLRHPFGHGKVVEAKLANLTYKKGDTWGPVPEATLAYRPADPWAISLEIRPGGPISNSATWTLSREAIATALSSGRGGGFEAKLEVVGAHLNITLQPPGHNAMTLRLPTSQAARFLRQSHESVRPGFESKHVNIDSEISRLRNNL